MSRRVKLDLQSAFLITVLLPRTIKRERERERERERKDKFFFPK